MALVLAVVFVNGWTDAPNAIATAVATRAISYRRAVWLAAGCNLAGLLLMSVVSVSVADTITTMADFGGISPVQSEIALCAAMAAIVLFAVCAWAFGIPTSESHALLAALAGAAFALGGKGSSAAVWVKILAGLILSLALGFFFGVLLARLLGGLLRRAGERLLDRLQILAAGAMAFMHGAQDGQKFAAVLIAASLLSQGIRTTEPLRLTEHLPVFVLCAVCMALGTAVGGKRIILSVGIRMVPLRKYQGVCADLGSSLCLLIASLSGIPMSTTHTKTAATLGAGISGNAGKADRGVIRKILAAWAFTFPVCGAIGYLLTRLFLSIGQ
jgi:PiT family inorganic phosphate transporter